MNTAVKIKSVGSVSAILKNAYNLTRQKNQKKDILVLEENSFPQRKMTLSPEQKKQVHALQKTISKCEKRLAEARVKKKEKSIETNKKNIEEAKKKLAKFEGKEDKREKYFTEFTIALTNSYVEDISIDWSLNTLNYIKQKYPELSVVSAVEHRDQSSPHMHILLHSPDKPVTQYLAEINGFENTSRESMKLAYSKIAHDYHDWAQDGVVEDGVRLDPLQKGRKYVSLGQFKKRGNFEVKLKEQEFEDERRRIEDASRRDRLDGIRERIFGSYAKIQELDAEINSTARFNEEITRIGNEFVGATEIISRISDAVERISDAVRRVKQSRIKVDEPIVDIVALQIQKNIAQRAEKKLQRQSPNQIIDKMPKP